MIFLDFPISGPLRLPLLLMECVFICTCMEFSFIFLYRYLKPEKDLRNLQELGYFALLLGFSLMFVFYIFSDYYASDDILSPFYIWREGSVRDVFLNLGYFTIMIAAFFFLLCIETYKVFLFKRYFFSILFSICAIGFLILFFIDIRITQTITYIFFSLFVIFLFFYLIEFSRKVQNREKLLIGMMKYIPGVGLLLIGFLFTTDALVGLLGLEARLMGDITQLIAIVLFSYFFLSLPPFSEFDWFDSIENIMILSKSGISLYSKIFQEKDKSLDEHIIGGAITGVKLLLDEITETQGVTVLKKKGTITMIYPGKYVTGVIFSSKELNALKVLLHKFVSKVESIYENVLKSWDGEIAVFEPIEYISNEIFKI